MPILNSYIGRTLLSTTLLVLLVLLGLDIFIEFIAELTTLGTGNYGLWQALFYVLLDAPQQLYRLFPMASLLGTLLGLGLLANHSELIVMRTAGVSLRQITLAILQTTIIMLTIAGIGGELLAPIAEHKAESWKMMATSGGQALRTVQGLWLRDGLNIMHIHVVNADGSLSGITRYEFDNQHRLIRSSFAERAYYQHKTWLVQDIRQSQIQPTQVTSQHIPQATWHLMINPSLLRISVVEPEEMTLTQLYAYIKYGRHNGLHVDKYSFAFWKRVFQPLATLVMLFLAIPFIFGPLRTSTNGLRLITGIVVGFIFYTLNEFLGPLSLVYQLPAMAAALVPILMFALVAYVLMRHSY